MLSCSTGSARSNCSADVSSSRCLRDRFDAAVAVAADGQRPCGGRFQAGVAVALGPGAGDRGRSGRPAAGDACSPCDLIWVRLFFVVARWPRQVRSGEGHPLALLRMRLADWGDRGRLLCISSPTLAHDAIGLLFRDGDRRRLEYPCSACGERFPFLWEQVTGREKGEQPSIACSACGALHDEDARRRMLRSAKWIAQRSDANDEDVISFTLGRLDSARSIIRPGRAGVATRATRSGAGRPGRDDGVPQHGARTPRGARRRRHRSPLRASTPGVRPERRRTGNRRSRRAGRSPRSRRARLRRRVRVPSGYSTTA